jgi:hypothetical protein
MTTKTLARRLTPESSQVKNGSCLRLKIAGPLTKLFIRAADFDSSYKSHLNLSLLEDAASEKGNRSAGEQSRLIIRGHSASGGGEFERHVAEN